MQLAKTQELVGHVGPVGLLLISSTENLLVSAGEDFSIRTWDTVAWQTQAVIREMDAGVHQSLMIGDISSCGEYLATGVADFRTKVYSLRENRLLKSLEKKRTDFPAWALRFSPTGSWLACQRGRAIDCFRVGDFAKVAELTGHTSKIHLMESSTDGRFLFTCGGKYVKVWDMATYAEILTITEHQRLLGSIAVSPTGEFFITGGEDKKVFVWRIGDWAQVGSYPEHKDFVFDIAISSDGKTAATWDMTRTLHFWHIKSPSCIGTLADLWGKGKFIGDRYLLFGGLGEKTVLIDASTASIVQELPKATAIAVAQSGQWVALAESDSVTIWQIH